jgi:hypothetical protein
MKPALRRRLATAAFGGIIALTAAPTAMAQWLPPWRAVPAGAIAGRLKAQGYVLIAPLQRFPGVYLADVRAGDGGYQRLVIDDRSGEILEYFMSPRYDRFGRPGSQPVPTKPKPQPAIARKTPSPKTGPPAVIAPSLPPTPREAAKPDESAPAAPKPEPKIESSPGETENPSTVVTPAAPEAKPEPVKIEPRKPEAQTQPPNSAPAPTASPTAPASSAELSRKSKIRIVPAPLFE